MADFGYLGNPLLKKSNTPIEWDAELMKEYYKCANDPIYFAEKYIKIVHVDRGLIPIELYDYQKEIIDAVGDNRRISVNTSRQAGKCVCIDTIVTIRIENIVFNITMGELHEIFLEEQNAVPFKFHSSISKFLNFVFQGKDETELKLFENNIEKNDLHSKTNRKFVKVFDVEGIEVWTPSGWEKISRFNVTVPYDKVKVKLADGRELDCADDHILIDANGNQIYARDSFGKFIKTETGNVLAIEVIDFKIKETMYDLTVDSKDHVYYTNGILSHNTTTAVVIILHYILFNEYKTVALLANKGATALEILNRLQVAYEALPSWLQQGVVVWNKGSMELENGCKVIASASSSSAIRGKSVSFLYVDECVSGDTIVTVRDKITGKIKMINVQDLYNGIFNSHECSCL